MGIFDIFRFRMFDRLDDDRQLSALNAACWPKDQSLILHVLENLSGSFRARAAAVAKLPYPEERERLIRIAKEDRDDFVRDHAIEKLQYPEDRDTLVYLASYEPGYQLVRRAVEKLPWPQEKETLVSLAKADNYPVFAVRSLDAEEMLSLLEDLALHSPDRDARRAAADKLEYPRSKEVLEQVVLSDNPPDDLFQFVNKLSWPESRDTLVRVALTSPQGKARAVAVAKLPWPEERETIEAVAHSPMHGDETCPDNWYATAAAQYFMAQQGVCPACGGEVLHEKDTVYMNDDPNDVSKEVDRYTCTKCGWKTDNE